jgi:hypothetical protein
VKRSSIPLTFWTSGSRSISEVTSFSSVIFEFSMSSLRVSYFQKRIPIVVLCTAIGMKLNQFCFWFIVWLFVAGCHQFSLDCTGLDVFKILPNRQVLNYPRQVTLAKSFNEKYRITA